MRGADTQTITGEQVSAAMLAAGLAPLEENRARQLAEYGNLLLRWNARTNLTAIRTPEGVLQRHLVECAAAARLLPADIGTLLDYGSGAGLPGIPIAILRPEIQVTLAESQARKVAFLREALRVLGVAAAIHAGRVESMGTSRLFDCCILRAVDGMERAIKVAADRLRPGGVLAVFATTASEEGLLQHFLNAERSQRLGERSRHSLPTAGYLILLR